MSGEYEVTVDVTRLDATPNPAPLDAELNLEARERELALRTALGASRTRMLLGSLMQSGLLSLIALLIALPLAQLGVDVPVAQATVDRFLSLPEVDWHADDWRRSHPAFPRKYAGVLYMYTDEQLGIYRVLGEAMHDAARGAAAAGVAARMRACLPLIKLLEVALQEAAIYWGFFVGQTLRGAAGGGGQVHAHFFCA